MIDIPEGYRLANAGDIGKQVIYGDIDDKDEIEERVLNPEEMEDILIRIENTDYPYVVRGGNRWVWALIKNERGKAMKRYRAATKDDVGKPAIFDDMNPDNLSIIKEFEGDLGNEKFVSSTGTRWRYAYIAEEMMPDIASTTTDKLIHEIARRGVKEFWGKDIEGTDFKWAIP